MSEEDPTEILRERIKQLEIENSIVKKELRRLKKNDGFQNQPDSVNAIEFKIEFKPNTKEFKSESQKVGDVEFSMHAVRRYEDFEAHLHVKNAVVANHKFVFTTITMKQRARAGYGSEEKQQTISPYSQHFVLCGEIDEEDQMGNRLITPLLDRNPLNLDIVVRVTVAIQQMESMDFGDETRTVVVVKDKEFHVSASYLSHWSHYFRAYFRADMKEKQEGVYHITDEDISPEDFEELLMVIYPAGKPITTHNYRALLKMASRFLMPEVTRRVELFLIDFDNNQLDRACVFRIATGPFQLKLVQSVLLHRWLDPKKLLKELLKTEHYEELGEDTKAMVNERFSRGCISGVAIASASDTVDRRGRGAHRHIFEDWREVGRGSRGDRADRDGGFGGSSRMRDGDMRAAFVRRVGEDEESTRAFDGDVDRDDAAIADDDW